MLLATLFWGMFFLCLIFLPLTLTWTFSLFDIFHRDDLSERSKARWVAAVILLPFFGTELYLFAKPSSDGLPRLGSPVRRREQAHYGRTRELEVLSDLHDRGKLTDDEFAAEKERLLGGAGARSTH